MHSKFHKHLHCAKLLLYHAVDVAMWITNLVLAILTICRFSRAK